MYKTGARQDSDINKQASDMDISRKLNVKNDLDEYGVFVCGMCVVCVCVCGMCVCVVCVCVCVRTHDWQEATRTCRRWTST